MTKPSVWRPFRPSANVNLGNLQRIWKTIEEDSRQYALDLELPFEQWSGESGYFKFGVFDDSVVRNFDQDSFTNDALGAEHEGGFDQPWSDVFDQQNHPIEESLYDVDYRGELDISAWYGMLDLPLSERWTLIGGARFEDTSIGIVNDPEEFAFYFPPGATAPVSLSPGVADVAIDQSDTLPSVGLVFEPTDAVTLRAAYSRTIARQTFKEITPIIQQEFLGGPIFIGNPELGLSALENYDLRLDYVPYEGSLVSLSWFVKHVDDAIEYVQKFVDFSYTTPVNYPQGEIRGIEVELRQDLGRFAEQVEGLSCGVNATFIDSQVDLPADEAALFADTVEVPLTKRAMTNAPENLYNFYLSYEFTEATEAALYYTVKGDTLVAGDGLAQGGATYVPAIYAEDYGTLNFTLSHKINDSFKLGFALKNLTNPEIEEVYRSDFVSGPDVLHTSYRRGIELSIGLTASF
jgi:TonB-dependent receptor